MKKHRLVAIEWPEFGIGELPPRESLEEIKKRIDTARKVMHRRALTHLVVYGDREHFANITYLSGFDPRFEEALLIVALEGDPLLLVGNEGEGYLTVSPLYKAGQLRSERFQSFSLLNQPRNASRFLKDICSSEGIEMGSVTGCIGWKYYADAEHPDGEHAIEIPAYIVDTLRELSGRENVINATDILMHPGEGLRSTCSVSEIAYFEYTSVLASEGMKRMLFGIQEGMTDHQLVQLSGYSGVPLGCHMTMLTGDTRDCGLTSPSGTTVRRGDPFATNVCYWGSNVCRAGWIASDAGDLPADARDYVEAFVGPYFEVLGEWFGMLKIGAPGGRLSQLINEKLPFDKFGIFLNAGHLIHLDEWLSSPVYPGSKLPLRSGMTIQVDVIPSSETYFSTRMEDGIVLADASLRQELQQAFPLCYARCQKRRAFMVEQLGIDLSEEVLPLSNMPAIVPPFLLNPNKIMVLE